jgi:DNA modification methylase
MKPVELVANCLLDCTKEKDIILDAFGGSGTTLIAAEQLNRKCYMMELDPHYCDVIIARWEKLTNGKAKKIDLT